MNLLDGARKLLQGWAPAPPPKPQRYSVTCPQGHRLSGQRTEGYQAVWCPTCGEGIFILPRSPLPDPVPPKESAARRRREAGLEVGDTYGASPALADDEAMTVTLTAPPPDDPGVLVEDSDTETEAETVAGRGRSDHAEEPAVARAHPPAQARKPRARDLPAEPEPPGLGAGAARRARGAAPPQRATAGARRPAAEAGRPRRSLSEWRGELIGWVRARPHRVLFVGVAALVVVTVGWRLWRSRYQELPRIAELGRDEGLKALDEGRFDKAHQLLSAARRAVESLGGAYEGAEEIIHGAEEAAILTNLAPQSLEAILGEAGRAEAAQWPAQFATFYKGRSVVIDAQVAAVPGPSGAGRYELDYRLLQEGEGARPARVGRIDTTGFRLFELAQPKVGDQVRFGARLASCTFDETTEEWLVRLEPESGVYMTHPRALEALGWPSPEQAAAEREEDKP